MIKVFGLAYYCQDYIAKSISSIVDNVDEQIELIVVENKSPHSKIIRESLKQFNRCGFISKAYCMMGNSRGNCLIDIARSELDGYNEDFFIITDLDILVPKCNLISKTREAISQGYNVTGLSLSTINYTPPNSGFVDGPGFGWWMMGIKTSEFLKIPEGVACTDSFILNYLKSFKKFPDKCYHYGWDIWKDYPEYWTDKARGIDWNTYTDNTIEEIIS